MGCISGFSVWLLSKHPSIQYAATVISIGPSVPAEPSLLSVQLHWVDHSVFFGLNTITTIDLFSGQLDYRRTAQKEAHRDLRVFVDHYGESKNKLVVNLVVGDFYRFMGFEWLPTEIKLSRAPRGPWINRLLCICSVRDVKNSSQKVSLVLSVSGYSSLTGNTEPKPKCC